MALALIPFFYTSSTLSYYEKHTKEELETTLSIVTTSYVRNDDIVSAVRENLKYIKPPLRDVFMAFEGEATAISSNVKHALYSLRDKVDDEIFREWCDALIQCQDDRTLKDTLLPIVGKLTDVRIVNNELKTLLMLTYDITVRYDIIVFLLDSVRKGDGSASVVIIQFVEFMICIGVEAIHTHLHQGGRSQADCIRRRNQ